MIRQSQCTDGSNHGVCPITQGEFADKSIVYVLKSDQDNVSRGEKVKVNLDVSFEHVVVLGGVHISCWVTHAFIQKRRQQISRSTQSTARRWATHDNKIRL